MAASEYKSRIVMLDVDPVHVANKAILGVFKSNQSMYIWILGWSSVMSKLLLWLVWLQWLF